MPDRGPAAGGAPQAAEPGRRRPNLAILLGFLGFFVLLILLFHGVLFPFLMAIFIAYLIEPLVAAFTRSPIFGIRWTRGPTIVLMYVVLLGGILTLTSCAVTSVIQSVRGVSREVASALQERAEQAHFTAVAPRDEGPGERREDRAEPGPAPRPPLEEEVRIPAGTRLVLRPHPPPPAAPGGRGAPSPGEGGEPPDAPPPAPPPPPAVFATVYDVRLSPAVREATVLLERTSESVPAGAAPGTVLDAEGIRRADGTSHPEAARSIVVTTGEQAVGLEVLIERRLISPIVHNIERAGFEVDPTQVRALLSTQARAVGEGLPERVRRGAAEFVTSLALSVYEFILILMLTAFIVMDRRAITRFFASLPPPRYRPAYETLVRYVDRGLAGVIRGQLVICVVNGLLTYVGLLAFEIKGALLLSVVAGIFSLIPIFGTILSTIPIVLLAATDGLGKGALALAWITFIHLLEANLLNPLIMGSHARMHPVVIIFALLAGEHAFGVWGALLAVPTASIIQSCFLYYRHEVEGVPYDPGRAHGDWVRRLWRNLRGTKPAEKAAGETP